jgi:hypothetical protein
MKEGLKEGLKEEGLKEGGRKTPNAGMGAGKVRNVECESVSVYTCMICVRSLMYFCLLVYAAEASATAMVNPTGMQGRQMAVVERIETLCLLTFF